jgi:crotonobetainyl-CoA:carnitine CoA-transferase CaiB-like acyl-CoA transferase
MMEETPLRPLPDDQRPLASILVLDFSQFLAGPACALRLADLGARVIKIERPDTGDLCRRLYISNLELDGDSTLFHSINRNKESFAADLKNPTDRDRVYGLIARADVLIQNFRPGVPERLGLDYATVHELNPRLIYGTITGYGDRGPWRDKPGQDLLAQSLSGLTWLSGDADQGPVPMGLAVADMFAGAHLAQGILACLVRRSFTGQGGLVEASLLESILDFQFEVLTTHLNDGGQPPRRSAINNAHAYLAAPYGIYRTADGYLALAMTPVPRLGELLDCPPLLAYSDPKSWFDERDTIKRILASHLATQTTAHWLAILEPADVWCADVFDWRKLLAHDGFKVLAMVQEVHRANGASLLTTRCPIRIDGGILTASRGAPKIGEHTATILEEFGL